MRADFSLARPVGHLIMGDGSGPDGLAEKDGAKALSGAESGDTATTQLNKPSRTKNLIIEYEDVKVELIKGQRLVVDKGGEVLVWIGNAGTSPVLLSVPAETPGRTPLTYTPPYMPQQAYGATRDIIERVKGRLRDPRLRASLEGSPLMRRIYDLCAS